MIVDRTPWPDGFPEVFVHSHLDARDADPDFNAAKSGDGEAATRLCQRLIASQVTREIARVVSPATIVLPVTALEVSGFNAIPDAMAEQLAIHLGLQLASGVVVQSNKVAHTRSRGWHRLVTPALFDGPVTVGAEYLLVDDHVGFGGTLTNLKGHVEARGGVVVAMTTISETQGGRTIAVRSDTLSMLQSTHGWRLEDLWRDHFGHGLDCLTDVEAGYLCRQSSFDKIRTRMAKAAEQARSRNLSTVARL